MVWCYLLALGRKIRSTGGLVAPELITLILTLGAAAFPIGILTPELVWLLNTLGLATGSWIIHGVSAVILLYIIYR